MVSFGWGTGVIASHLDSSSGSDSNLLLSIIEMGDSDFSSSELNHQGTVLVWSQSLGLFELVYQFQI